ncbi:conserved hypothetical protein [Trichinella spiralis]|uniref:hypothetical protein n=1 Tax=Trichinella spiralis TaxID=6334 RepID=UPI0001EFE457|nr:conserved hypothetical protein [Trichinella spiralis]
MGDGVGSGSGGSSREEKECDRKPGRINHVVATDIGTWDRDLRIINGYWKIVLVNDVDHFIGLGRECESQQKIMGRRVARKQAQKAKITNDIKIHFNHESQSNKLKVLI